MRTASPSNSILIDDTYFPLVDVCFRDGHEDRDWAWMLQRYESLFAGKMRYALLLDSSPLTHTPSAHARKQITDWQNGNKQNTARWNVGASVYIASGLIRGALTAMNWFAQQPVPMNYPASMAEGVDWCVARLEEANLPVPQLIRQRQFAMLKDVASASPSARPLRTDPPRRRTSY